MGKERKVEETIYSKSNRILNGILVVLILIVIRIWHLAVVQHDEKVALSLKPQKRTIVEKANRATISDRFGETLAHNKIQYNVCVAYGGIREIPRTIWQEKDGKKIKIPRRKEYIHELSEMIGNELGLDPERVEDTIHSKAALFGNVPCVIKENIPEEKYFHLKMLEKDWPGLVAEKCGKRHYPQGKACAEVVGYLGAISKVEYEKITNEMQELRSELTAHEEGQETETSKKAYHYLEEVGARLKELEGKAYTLNDLVGKAGVEKSFEEALRGSNGATTYLSDPRGNFLQELPSQIPAPGSKVTLTIWKELQEYAERLLTEYEQAPIPGHPAVTKLYSFFPEKQPWIKGGAIVVMDPNTGDVLALASYPRFDPNDFAKGGNREGVQKWLESEEYLGNVWNRKQTLSKERFNSSKGTFFDEEMDLTWRNYLRMILPKSSPVLATIEKKNTLADAFRIQEKADLLFSYFAGIHPAKVIDFLYGGDSVQITLTEKDLLKGYLEKYRETIDALKGDLKPYFSQVGHNLDKLLLLDLYRLSVDPQKFSSDLKALIGNLTIEEFQETSHVLGNFRMSLQKCVKEAFHQIHFKKWREKHFSDYLALKRQEEEKCKKKWGKPYLEYLDEAEKKYFENFWEKNQWPLIYSLLTKEQLRGNLAPYEEKLSQLKTPDELKKLLPSFKEDSLVAYLKTHRSYNELTRPLYGIYKGMRSENGKTLEKHLATAFYPRGGFGYARSHAFRQSATIGSVFKLVPAYEALRQRYESCQKNGKLSSDLNPLTIIDDYVQEGTTVGSTLSQKPIPRFYKGGKIARTDHRGVGKIDLVGALAASSNPYFALLAADHMEDPEDLCKAACVFSYGEKTGIDLPGEIKGNIPLDVSYNRTGLYSFTMGQHSLVGTPLQTAVMLSAIANGGKVLKPKIVAERNGVEEKTVVRREVFLPAVIRKPLLQGMQQVIHGEKGTARMLQNTFPKELLSRVVGKTSTAEAMEKMSLDSSCGSVKCKHVAFNSIYFGKGGEFEKPELVVIVYLRFGQFGWGAAPYAMKMIQKWEEMRKEK